MSDAVFVTQEGYPLFRKDMEEHDLSVSEYWKMVCVARDGDSLLSVRRIISCIDAHINGTTNHAMREWTNHRETENDLEDAIVSWRCKWRLQ